MSILSKLRHHLENSDPVLDEQPCEKAAVELITAKLEAKKRELETELQGQVLNREMTIHRLRLNIRALQEEVKELEKERGEMALVLTQRW
jgi:hypothetical protein